MIIEQDKASSNLFIASGEILGFPIITEGASQFDAMTQWIACARDRLIRERGYDNVAALGVVQ